MYLVWEKGVRWSDSMNLRLKNTIPVFSAGEYHEFVCKWDFVFCFIFGFKGVRDLCSFYLLICYQISSLQDTRIIYMLLCAYNVRIISHFVTDQKWLICECVGLCEWVFRWGKLMKPVVLVGWWLKSILGRKGKAEMSPRNKIRLRVGKDAMHGGLRIQLVSLWTCICLCTCKLPDNRSIKWQVVWL